MSGLFIIPLSGLKVGHYDYEYVISNKFFDKFEESEIKEGNLIANIELIKRSSHFDITIKIKGGVKISCDRCLEMFLFPVESENRFLVEFGKTTNLDDPDVLIIPPDEKELDLSKYIYEFVHLALPIKRVHPEDENGESTCDPYMMIKLKEHLVENEKENDSRWEELKKLMNDN
jgi:uncharacterized protein